MSIVALKRKINAKNNISNRKISSFTVHTSQPGVNAKRGLVSRSTGSVVNRRKKIQNKSFHSQMANPTETVNVTPDTDKRSGFYLNGTKNINGIVQKDKKPGCCSDDGSSVKRTVSGTKGMLDSRKYRNGNCCFPSNEEKMCDKKAFKHIEKMKATASDVTANKKRQTEICVNPVICPGDSPTTDSTIYCCSGAKSIHINHSNKTAISSSDYLLKKKSRNQVKITSTDQSISTICTDTVKTSKTNC